MGPNTITDTKRQSKSYGPAPKPLSRFRQTEEAILELANLAKLVAAANRGVVIRLILETPHRIDGRGKYYCLLALGNNVASACSVYFWPQENRDKDDNGKIGILHVKCAVADGHRMFLSSANFTEYAFTINMELGLLVTGGTLPGQVEAHFYRLVEAGILAKI